MRIEQQFRLAKESDKPKNPNNSIFFADKSAVPPAVRRFSMDKRIFHEHFPEKMRVIFEWE
jgi:hypothetical protein